MNKAGEVYFNNILAGRLERDSKGYTFAYNADYLAETSLPSISISFPKSKKAFNSKELFPFFYGLLSEGVNKEMQCNILKIDNRDHFTRLLKTANNSIGAVTVREAI